MRTLNFAVISLAAAGGAAATRLGPAEPPPARETGRPVSCLTLHQIRSMHAHDDETIDFTMKNGMVYRNRLSHNCPGLGSEKAFSYRSQTGRLCSADTITVREPPGLWASASCGLGEFQPVEAID